MPAVYCAYWAVVVDIPCYFVAVGVYAAVVKNYVAVAVFAVVDSVAVLVFYAARFVGAYNLASVFSLAVRRVAAVFAYIVAVPC